eukprot:jgi/Ulvmu1/2637/UM014_0089.1
MMQQCEAANTYEHLRSSLLLVADPHVSRSKREECERYLNAFAHEACRTAATALRHQSVLLDPLLCWYYISCVERHAGMEFWTLDTSAQQRLFENVQEIVSICQHASNPLTLKVYSLNSTVLCWGASQDDPTATAALMQLITPPPGTTPGSHPEVWQVQLQRCIVLIDDMQSGLLRVDASCAGVLPAAYLRALRRRFYHDMHRNISALALVGVRSAPAEPHADGAPSLLTLSLDLLAKVMSTVKSVDALPVTPVDVLDVVMPHLPSSTADVAAAAVRAAESVAAMPCVPKVRHELHARLLTFLGGPGRSMRPALARAQLARAAIEAAGLTALKLSPQTSHALQGLLDAAAEDARGQTTAAEFLFSLEPWMLWLARLVDEQEGVQVEAERAAVAAQAEPFKARALALLLALIPCLVHLDGVEAQMAISAGGMATESYSGAALEEALAPLLLSEGDADADVEYAAHLAEATGGPVSPQSSEDLCSALSDYSTSAHGVFCACVENVAARAVTLCGPPAAAAVWHAAGSALHVRGDAILGGGGEGERAALDVHVIARLAARSAHELDGAAAEAVLGHAQRYIEWLARALKMLEAAGPAASHRPVMISAAAVFKCLSALAALWVPAAQVMAAPEQQPHVRAFVSALFEFSVTTIRTAILRSADTHVAEECHHLAGCASEALLATTHIAVNAGTADAAHIAALRSSSAAHTLAGACVAMALPPDAAWASVPERVQRDTWMASADVFVAWTGHVRDAGAAEWEFAAQSMQHVCAPVAKAWSDMHACAGADGFDWKGTMQQLRPLCAFASALLAAVGPRARHGRRCMFAAVKPMVVAGIEVMAAAQHARASGAALTLSRLMVASVQNSLKEMPIELIDRIMAVSATATHGDALAQQQVAQLVWRVGDDASPHVAPLLSGALSFLLRTMDGLTPAQVAGSAAHAACMRQCLTAALHVLSRRYQALEAADAGMKAAPAAVAQRLAVYLEAAAAGHVASVHAGDLRELLEEFFDMQRVTGLYKRQAFAELRLLLEKALVSMLINPIADGAKEQLLDVLWGVGSLDWDEFVQKLLPGLCSVGPNVVRERAATLVQPFNDQSGSLHDFAHFHACMDDFVNDIRFFRKLCEAEQAEAVA